MYMYVLYCTVAPKSHIQIIIDFSKLYILGMFAILFNQLVPRLVLVNV